MTEWAAASFMTVERLVGTFDKWEPPEGLPLTRCAFWVGERVTLSPSLAVLVTVLVTKLSWYTAI